MWQIIHQFYLTLQRAEKELGFYQKQKLVLSQFYWMHKVKSTWGMHRLDCEKSESHSSVIVISASFTLLTFIQSNCKLLLFIWFHVECNGYCQTDSFKDWSLSLWPKIPPGIFRKEWQDGVSWQTLGSSLSYWHSKPRTHPTKCCSFHLQSLVSLKYLLCLNKVSKLCHPLSHNELKDLIKSFPERSFQKSRKCLKSHMIWKTNVPEREGTEKRVDELKTYCCLMHILASVALCLALKNITSYSQPLLRLNQLL